MISYTVVAEEYGAIMLKDLLHRSSYHHSCYTGQLDCTILAFHCIVPYELLAEHTSLFVSLNRSSF